MVEKVGRIVSFTLNVIGSATVQDVAINPLSNTPMTISNNIQYNFDNSASVQGVTFDTLVSVKQVIISTGGSQSTVRFGGLR